MRTWDIETAPLPDEELRKWLPEFDTAPFLPTQFDSDSVKYGNIKDPNKRSAKLKQCQMEHAKQQANLKDAEEQARAKHWEGFKAKASLSAATGHVVCIGLYSAVKDNFVCLGGDGVPESTVLAMFWDFAENTIAANQPFVGVNIFDFDLPFLVRRSWHHRVPVPPRVAHDLASKWPKYHPRVVDLRQRWLLGQSWSNTKSSFAHLAEFFGTAGKCTEGCDGATFHQVWQSDRATALRYLEEDVRQPAEWAQRMGVK